MRRCSLDGKNGLWLEPEGWLDLGRIAMGYGPMTKSSRLQNQSKANMCIAHVSGELDTCPVEASAQQDTSF